MSSLPDIKVAQLTWSLSSAGGGIPPVVFGVSAALRAAGRSVSLLGVDVDGDSSIPELGAGDAVYACNGPRALGWSPGVWRRLTSERWDVVHLHGLFTWTSRAAARWSIRTHRPVVVSPHGMLEPWALRNSRWKKRIFSLLVENANLRSAACIHALCAEEAANIRRLGWDRPIAIVPNGVKLEEAQPCAGDPDFRRMHGVASATPILLFLSRVHPKKGLQPLLHAWAAVQRQNPGWLLVVAGPDQLGHTREMQALARELDIERHVRFVGPLYGSAKRAAFAAANAFVLPSFSEGFSMATLEALAWALPVLITRQCNFDVGSFGAGWVTEPTRAALTEALCRMVLTPADALREMGRRGRIEVERAYTWPRVAAQLWEVYRWVTGGGERPLCVL